MSAGNYLSYALLGLAAGAFIPVMAALSGALGRSIANPNMAALLVVTGAALMVLCFTLATGAFRAPQAALAQATPLQLVSGFGMAFYLLAITFLAPRIGVGNAVMFVVVAQLVSSALIDHFALFGAPHKPVSAQRLLGLAVLAVGAIIAQTAANGARPNQ
jgi:transporter family-2 protein